MFFHRIERLKDDHWKEEVSAALMGEAFTVIPLVEPGSATGQFLMDKNESKFISNYSGDKVGIFYIGEELKTEFQHFISHIHLELLDFSGSDKIEPGILVIFPRKERLITIEIDAADNPRRFRVILFQLIDTLKSKEPLKNINLLKCEVTALLDNRNSELIDKIYGHVETFFI